MNPYLQITHKMSGKMEGMVSINTSSLANKFCQTMSKKPDSICNSCYSNRLLKMYKTAETRFKLNADYLSKAIHPVYDMPLINASIVRFNAYGELVNYNHLVNLFSICERNKRTTFTLWTKLDGLVAKAVRDWGKPKNLILIYSSENVNERESMPLHFDKVFTVYDDKKKLPKSMKINCGESKCINCLTCYTLGDRTKYINEWKK